MQATQQPSTFAQIIDKLRDKSEAELKQLYIRLSADSLIEEWKEITEEAEWRTKSKKDKKSDLEKVFGIWKNENISLESIRQQAWQREK